MTNGEATDMERWGSPFSGKYGNSPNRISDDDLKGLAEWLMVYDNEMNDPKEIDRTWTRLQQGIEALRFQRNEWRDLANRNAQVLEEAKTAIEERDTRLAKFIAAAKQHGINLSYDREYAEGR